MKKNNFNTQKSVEEILEELRSMREAQDREMAKVYELASKKVTQK